MPTQRDVLALLSRDELLAAVDRFGLTPPDRRAKDGLVETLAASHRATLPEVLGAFARDRLKELCRELGLDDSGREKALIIGRLAGSTPAAPATAARTPAAKAAPAPAPVELTPGARLTVDALERYLTSVAPRPGS